MWRLHKAKPVLTGAQNFVVVHALRWTQCKVVYTHHGADHAAHGLGIRCNLQPLIERATLISLKVTKANPSDSRRINHSSNRIANYWKKRFHSSVK
jgi:hypothetical protein